MLLTAIFNKPQTTKQTLNLQFCHMAAALTMMIFDHLCQVVKWV